MALEPQRTITELKELRALTGDENGAQRVAFTPVWIAARAWLRKNWRRSRWKPTSTPRGILVDAARRFRARARDRRPHGFRAERRLARWLPQTFSPASRFSVASTPSIAASRPSRCGWSIGPTRKARVSGKPFRFVGPAPAISTGGGARAQGQNGIGLPQALKEIGVEFERVKESGRELKNAAAYLGVAHRTRAGAARFESAARCGARDIWRRATRDHVSRPAAPLGQHADEPAPGRVSRCGEDEPGNLSDREKARRRLHDWLVHHETRHHDECGGRVPHHARSASSRCGRARADAGGCARSRRSGSHRRAACGWRGAASGKSRPCFFSAISLGSATPRSRRPAAARRIVCRRVRCTMPRKSPVPGCRRLMMFVQSLHGISHNKIEDTKEEHLELCVKAFDQLAAKTMAWIEA